MVAPTSEVEPDSELARLLRMSRDARLVLVLEGERFRVEPETSSPDDLAEEELWADLDPEQFLEGIDAAAGGWSHLDTERIKADIRRWRDEGSRPADRP